MVKANRLTVLGIVCLATLLRAEMPKLASAMTVEPKTFVTIQAVDSTGDIVQIQTASGTYKREGMERVAQSIAKSLGGAHRNFEYLDEGIGKQEKAFFVVDGLVSKSEGEILLQPLIRSLMLDASGRLVDGFKVTVVGIQPNAYTTLASYSSSAVDLKARYDPNIPSIEFRLALRTSNPLQLNIPPKYTPLETIVDADAKKPGKTWLIILLVIAAGASAGALVYFALLGKRA